MLKTALLARVPIFQELDPQELEGIASVLRFETYGSDREIVRMGDPGHSLYVIVEGNVAVECTPRSAGIDTPRLGAGQSFGEILNGKPQDATVKAVDEVKVLVLDKNDFTQIVRKSPDVALRVMSALSSRTRSSDAQRVADRSARDGLTGLPTHGSFHERLTAECERGRRSGDAFSIILVDIDHFKKLNDSFGPEVGDLVLNSIGRLLVEHTRGEDVPFRIGGEEFAVICPGTGVSGAAVVARRLVEVVEKAKSPTSFPLNVTVSAGFASCPVHGKRGDQVLGAANQALLKAKHEGRNRVAAAPAF